MLSRARLRQRLPQFTFSLTRIGCGETARIQALSQRHIRRGQGVSDKTLAGTGNEQAVAQAVQLINSGEQLPVLHATLREAQTRVKNQVLRQHTGGKETLTQAGQLPHNLGDHAARVLRQAVHGLGGAAGVHEDVRHLQFGGGFNHFIAHVQTGHIVDDVRTRGDGGTGSLRVHGVHANGGAHLRDCLNNGQDAALLLLHTDADCTGAGGFAANIDNGGALSDHAGGVGDSIGGGIVLSAVTEGVGGDVEDAHHEGAFSSERIAGQRGYTSGVCGFSHKFIVPNLRCSHVCRCDWKRYLGGGRDTDGAILVTRHAIFALQIPI